MAEAVFPDLNGASVFITGGGSGIGAAVTEAFLRQGARVAFVQRSDAGPFVEALAARTGAQALFRRCDITDTPALKAAMADAAAAHGPIQILINNAANDQRHSLDGSDEAYWDRMMAINLKAYFFAAQAAAPAMRAARAGSIINFSSISYMMGNSGYPIYAAANAAITGLTRSLARELGPDGVRVNALAPGWVMTEKQRAQWANPEAVAAHLERQCLKETLQAEDISSSALFLASRASRMMTGQVLVIDGGVVVTG